MFHLPCLLPPSEQTGINIWKHCCCWQHTHSWSSNLQPWSRTHTSPAFTWAHKGQVLFTLPKCSETFNLSKDCAFAFLQGRGQKLIIIKKEQETRQLLFPCALWGTCPVEVIPPEANTMSPPRCQNRGWTGHTSPGLDPWTDYYRMPKCTFSLYIATSCYLRILECYLGFKSADLVLVSFSDFSQHKSWKSCHSQGKRAQCLCNLSQTSESNFFPLFSSHRGGQQTHRMPNYFPTALLTDSSVMHQTRVPSGQKPGPNPSSARRCARRACTDSGQWEELCAIKYLWTFLHIFSI